VVVIRTWPVWVVSARQGHAMRRESLYKIATLMGNSPEICRRHYAALVPNELTGSVEFGQPREGKGVRFFGRCPLSQPSTGHPTDHSPELAGEKPACRLS